MKINKPLSMKEFLSYEKIVWHDFDDYAPTFYIFYVYPDMDTSLVSTYTLQNTKKAYKTEEIDTSGILSQLNEAIKRGDDVWGTENKSLKGHYIKKPSKKCTNAYKKMIGELPKCKLTL